MSPGIVSGFGSVSWHVFRVTSRIGISGLAAYRATRRIVILSGPDCRAAAVPFSAALWRFWCDVTTSRGWRPTARAAELQLSRAGQHRHTESAARPDHRETGPARIGTLSDHSRLIDGQWSVVSGHS